MRRIPRVLVKLVCGLLIAGLVMCLAEGLLRLFKIGRPPPFFLVQKTPRGERLAINPDYIARYFFYQPFQRVRMQPRQPWRRDMGRTREPGTLRVVALGESSTQGFPHPHRLAFPAMAQRMLEIRHPNLRVEVINAGVVAINSFAVLDIGKHMLDELAPDVLVVYAGHNEFHGVFGAASRAGLGGNGRLLRFIQFMWNSNVFTLFEHVVGGASQLFLATEETGTPMEILALGQAVRPGDAAHRRAAENFRTNLALLIEHAASRGVPVVLMPPVSNLKNMPPLASLTNNGRPLKDDDAIHDIERLRATGNFEALRRRSEDFITSDSPAAIWHYFLGHALLARGDAVAAKASFEAAKELDALQFRACNDLVDVILSFGNPSKRPTGSNVHVVDPRPAFEQVSPHGLPGSELFYEHVHPTFPGNLILAWSATLGIERVKGMRSAAPDFPHEAYMRRNAQFTVDRFMAALKIDHLIQDWPYKERAEMDPLRSHVVELKNEAWAKMDGIQRGVIREEGPKLIRMDEPALYADIGHAYLESDSPLLALPFLDASLAEMPDEPDVALHLGITWLMLGNPPRAIPVLSQASALDPNNARTRYNLGIAYAQTGQFPHAESSFRESIRLEPHLPDARVGLAMILIEKKEMAAARKEISTILEQDPTNPKALRLLAKIR